MGKLPSGYAAAVAPACSGVMLPRPRVKKSLISDSKRPVLVEHGGWYEWIVNHGDT